MTTKVKNKTENLDFKKQIAKHLANINHYSNMVHANMEGSDEEQINEDLQKNTDAQSSMDEIKNVTDEIYSFDLPEDIIQASLYGKKDSEQDEEGEEDKEEEENDDKMRVVYSNENKITDSSSSDEGKLKDIEMLMNLKKWSKPEKITKNISKVNISEEQMNESSETWLDSNTSLPKGYNEIPEILNNSQSVKNSESFISSSSSTAPSQKTVRSIRNGRIDRPPPTPKSPFENDNDDDDKHFKSKLRGFTGLDFSLPKKQFEEQVISYAEKNFKKAEKEAKKEILKIKKEIVNKTKPLNIINKSKTEKPQTKNDEWEDMPSSSADETEIDEILEKEEDIEAMVNRKLEQCQKAMTDDLKKNPKLLEDPIAYCFKKGVNEEFQKLVDLSLKSLYPSSKESSSKMKNNTKTSQPSSSKIKNKIVDVMNKGKTTTKNLDEPSTSKSEFGENPKIKKNTTKDPEISEQDLDSLLIEKHFLDTLPENLESLINMSPNREMETLFKNPKNKTRPISRSSSRSLRTDKGPKFRINPSSIKKTEPKNKSRHSVDTKSLKLAMMSSKHIPDSLKMALAKKYSVGNSIEEDEEIIKKTKKKKKDYFSEDFMKLIDDMSNIETESDFERKMNISGEGDANIIKSKKQLLKDSIFPPPSSKDIQDIQTLTEGLPPEFKKFADLLSTFEYVDKDDELEDFGEMDLQESSLRQLVDDLGSKLCRSDILDTPSFSKNLENPVETNPKPKNIQSKKMVPYTSQRNIRRSSSTSSIESLKRLAITAPPQRKTNSKFTLSNRKTTMKKMPACIYSSSSGDEQKEDARTKNFRGWGRDNRRASKRRTNLGSLAGWTWDTFLTRKQSNVSFSQQEMLEFRNVVSSLDKRLLRVEGRKPQYGPFPVKRLSTSSGVNRKIKQKQIERENLALLNRFEKVRPSVGSFR